MVIACNSVNEKYGRWIDRKIGAPLLRRAAAVVVKENCFQTCILNNLND